MSLDVYIKYKKKERVEYNYSVSTCGSTAKVIPGGYEETDEWWANITHNMGKMARAIPVLAEDGKVSTLYDYVWRPEEQEEKVDTTVMYRVLVEGISYMIAHRKELLKLNPENGWGSYDAFLKWLISYKEACEDHPGCEVFTSR